MPANTTRRKMFFRTTRFQQPIIRLILLPTIITYLVIFFYVCYFQYQVIRTVYSGDVTGVDIIRDQTTLVFAFLWFSFLGVGIWTLHTSSRLVGAFERILRELDDIIAGKGKRHIHARKGDTLANELLERINRLIDKLP